MEEAEAIIPLKRTPRQKQDKIDDSIITESFDMDLLGGTGRWNQ